MSNEEAREEISNVMNYVCDHCVREDTCGNNLCESLEALDMAKKALERLDVLEDMELAFVSFEQMAIKLRKAREAKREYGR